MEGGMDDLIKALTVPFAAGFMVQRLLEIAAPYTTAHIQYPLKKKEAMGAISLVHRRAAVRGGAHRNSDDSASGCTRRGQSSAAHCLMVCVD
jgi:hypothetical protein